MIERVSITRSTERMFMLPVIEAEALNIVVIGPCWKVGGRICFRFRNLSMAFRKSGKPGQDVCLVFLKQTFIVYFVLFVMVDCIFVSECQYRLFVR